MVISPQRLPHNGFSGLLEVSSAVAIKGEKLMLGPRIVVDTAGVPIWSPTPNWKRLQAQPHLIQAQLPLLRSIGPDDRQPFNEKSVVSPLFHSHWSIQSIMTAASISAIDALVEGLRQHDLAACSTAASRLAGLGEGLTPAGDDFLLGVVYALWAALPSERAVPLVTAITAAAIPRTTRLSAAWLKAAARGEAGAAWHALIDSLANGQETAVVTAVQRILASGHTSGPAAWCGFVTTLSLH